MVLSTASTPFLDPKRQEGTVSDSFSVYFRQKRRINSSVFPDFLHFYRFRAFSELLSVFGECNFTFGDERVILGLGVYGNLLVSLAKKNKES